MNATKPEYQIDLAMCGDVGDDFDLREFRDRLQRACDTAEIEVEIVPVTDSWNGARNSDDTETLIPDGLFFEILAVYAQES